MTAVRSASCSATDSPVAASLRPWAGHLASAGLSVRLPLLPGHGTEWQQMQITRWPDWYDCLERELLDLADQCERVFVMGLSMGGTLTLRLALERRSWSRASRSSARCTRRTPRCARSRPCVTC